MHNRKILIVHPYARTSFFLGRISNYLIVNFPNEIHYYNIKPNEKSHEDCLKRISQHSNDGLIIFLGHGRTDCLLGGRTDKANSTVSESARCEFPDEYYSKDNFINVSNVDVFKNKKVFCLACNSNKKISDFAVSKGATVFLGFGDIPTTIGEFNEMEIRVSENLISVLKGEVNYIIKKSISYSLLREYTFNQLLDLIYFISNQRITTIIKNRKGLKERRILAEWLYHIKNGILIKGDQNIKLIS